MLPILLALLLTSRTYDIVAYEAYQAAERGDLKASADLTMETGRLGGPDRELFFYAAAGVYTSIGENDSAITALEAAMDAGFADAQRITIDPDLASLQSHPRWNAMAATMAAKEQALDGTLKSPELRRELLLMWATDQKARITLGRKQKELGVPWDSPSLSSFYGDIDEVDARNDVRIKAIVAAHGWPAISAVGRDGAWAAWAIVQHADDVAFQLRCLAMMKAMLKKGEARAQEFAELHDRIRRNQRRRQTYGMATQDTAFYPIEDEGNLDRRRRALGLQPPRAEAMMHGFQYTPLSVATAKRRDGRDKLRARDLIRQANDHFDASRYEEAREQLATAIRLGIVSDTDLRAAAARFVQVKEQQSAAFLYLRILCYRGTLRTSDVPAVEITDRYLATCLRGQ